MADGPTIIPVQQSPDNPASRHAAANGPQHTPERDDGWTVSMLIIAVLSILLVSVQQNTMFIPKTCHETNTFANRTWLAVWPQI